MKVEFPRCQKKKSWNCFGNLNCEWLDYNHSLFNKMIQISQILQICKKIFDDGFEDGMIVKMNRKCMDCVEN